MMKNDEKIYEAIEPFLIAAMEEARDVLTPEERKRMVVIACEIVENFC